MAWRARLTRSNLRSLAGLCTLTLLGGLIVDTPHAAASQQAFDNLLNYSCEFINGPQPVSVRIQGRLPLRVTADSPIQPEQIQVSVNIAPTVLKGLTGLGSGPITGSVQFNTKVTQGKRSGIVKWPKLAVTPAKPDSSNGLTLTAAGAVPPINGAKAGSGALSVAATTLVLSMAPQQGTKAAIAAGKMSMLCQPLQQKAATLGKVAVAAHAAPEAATPTLTECPGPTPTNGMNPDLPSATPRPIDTVATNDPLPPPQCAQANGTSNAAKLHEGAQVTGVATAIVPYSAVRAVDPTVDPRVWENLPATLHFDPSRGTFLGFGFMPVTATVSLVPLGTANGILKIPGTNSFPPPTFVTDFYAKVDLRVSNASVNGVKLNLGTKCRIVHPISLHLQGTSDSDPPYIPATVGGPLTGTFTIPAFTGCGVGENLDPILNASISGPNNFVRAIQGFPCMFGYTPVRCPPHAAGFAVTPGGKWSGSGTHDIWFNGYNGFIGFTCDMSVSGSFKPGRNFWFGIGSVDTFDITSCTDLMNPFGDPVEIKVDSLPWAIDVETAGEAGPDLAQLNMRYAKITLSLQGCSAVFSSVNSRAGSIDTDASTINFMNYDESAGAFDFSRLHLNLVSFDGCEDSGLPYFDMGDGDPNLYPNYVDIEGADTQFPTSPIQRFTQ